MSMPNCWWVRANALCNSGKEQRLVAEGALQQGVGRQLLLLVAAAVNAQKEQVVQRQLASQAALDAQPTAPWPGAASGRAASCRMLL